MRAFQECLDDRQDPGRDLRWMTGLILVMRRDWRRETGVPPTPPLLVSSCSPDQRWESDTRTRSGASGRSGEAREGSCPEPLKHGECSEGGDSGRVHVYISTEVVQHLIRLFSMNGGRFLLEFQDYVQK